MLKFFTARNTVCVLVAVFAVGSIIYVNTTSMTFVDSKPDGTSIVASGGNPLLKATKQDVAAWFPGTCFAEIYMKSPSYKGSLIQGCMQKTAQEIKAQTGETVRDEDFRSPEVISHFKTVYGASNPWRT
ncbi:MULTISPECIES: hypothetical protein [Pseudomonas]|uniref:Uncharacterized protein n=1 Tax=Pseudomonas syringae pv. actinidiae TaxID=103796 RepID=A0A2P0QFK4_PSESF|nr:MULTISPECIES: hypothetical protein [Pseudomonas]APQ06992.1 hypothetical protein PsaNZ47_30095 [Pseudomonas syringae pv. actinidiae]ARO44977.1 hypothetical protein [Pseudomonas syringae pv. actinidiae]ARO45082.1 hypothetical protein [Pseudomonas syringae pv. actinidiae]ARO45173.1 hypothetical protein [Pseudomonas syringae pv. actinidiae]ARO45215.1 hypothetical protein [Pseudomonas syringae pv. actinidiae]